MLSSKSVKILLCIVVAATIVLVIFYTYDEGEIGSQARMLSDKLYDQLARSVGSATDSSSGNSLIIDTKACKIPKTDIMPKYFRKGKGSWRVQDTPKCGYEDLLSVLENDQILHLLPQHGPETKNCCLHQITRKHANSDQKYNLNTCEPFQQDADVYGKTMLLTKCGDSLNFEATLPLNIPSVQKKIKYWNNRKPYKKDPPVINVLFIGIDSVSRSHAYRSIPKTLSYLKNDMDFIDFNGYHSIQGSTLTNFMGFLMGLRRPEVRKTCAPDWTSPFDSCPLIWKEFDKRNYTTMYVEDGSQTFNWGGQSGFEKEPTDYYIHLLFTAVLEIRRKYSKSRNPGVSEDNYAYCASNETIPKFLLRYTDRFVQKFYKTPFFAFTWFANPFHDFMFTLQSMEVELLNFFQRLNSLPGLTDNALIIFNSDHGDRTSFFHSDAIEAYIERALPPLFIRLPAQLKLRYPDFEVALRTNSKKLVSPFDLHHTLLHILHLEPSAKNSSFNPVMPDRSSLFIPVDDLRTCQQLNILPSDCACNTATNVEPIHNPYLLGKLMSYIQQMLNKIVQTSKYSKVCSKWTADVDSILSTQVLQKTESYTDNLVKFSANPMKADFEAKLRVHHVKSEFDSCELLGSFNRINHYGNQSHCVDYKTDKDKEMKEFCVCKDLTKDDSQHPT